MNCLFKSKKAIRRSSRCRCKKQVPWCKKFNRQLKPGVCKDCEFLPETASVTNDFDLTQLTIPKELEAVSHTVIDAKAPIAYEAQLDQSHTAGQLFQDFQVVLDVKPNSQITLQGKKADWLITGVGGIRSEEHTSELQSH